MFQNFYPDEDADSAYQLDYQKYYDDGYRGFCLMGFRTCIISNNKEKRVRPFADALEAFYIYKAGKPSPRGYVQGMEKMGTTPETTLFVGDQIFTDVWGANRAGMHSVLVKQIARHEEIQIVCKRFFEKIVLFEYRRKKRKKRKQSQIRS